MTTQPITNNRDRRTRGADTLKASRYFDTAAPVPKQTGDPNKGATGRTKRQRRTNPKPPAISDRAKKIISKGATDNPDGENTVLISTWRGSATCVRIFRQKHLLDDPKTGAEHWVREIRRRCSCREDAIRACAFVEPHQGDVTVVIYGEGTMAREEGGHGNQ